MQVKVFSLIHEVTLADSLDLPPDAAEEFKGQYRVMLETPFPQDGTSFFFASYMSLEYFHAHKFQNRLVEEMPIEYLVYRRERAKPRRF